MTAKIVASCLLVAGAVAQTPPAKQETGLVAQLKSLGVTQETYPYLTAAVKLTNNSPAYVFVLLIGAPRADDGAGGTFQAAAGAVTGIAYCLGREGLPAPDPRSCVKPREEQFFFAPDMYTEIEPGQSANFNVMLRAVRGSKGSKYNLAQEIAFRVVKPADIEQDQNISADKKIKALRFGSMDFSLVDAPPKELVTSTIKFDAVK